MGLSSTQAKVEGIVLKAAWHWGRDCSVLNDLVYSSQGGRYRAKGCMELG